MGRLVALALPGGPAYADAIRRVWDDGDAIAPLDPRLPGPEAERVLTALRPSAVIEGDGQPRSLPGGEPVEDGDGLVIATSGTSGLPKAVIHTHRSIEASAEAIHEALAVDRTSDKWLACLPLAHIGGLSVVMRSLITDTPVEIHDGFDAAAVKTAAVGGATLTSLVTRALNQIDSAGFRTILIGGAAPPPDREPNVIATYGMTETGSGVVYESTPLVGLEIAIGDPGEATEPGGSAEFGESARSGGSTPAGEPGEQGEIHLRGPMLFRGYRDGPDPFVAGGWFPTGDLGSWGPSGELVVAGRRGDMIVTGGENVWPEPIERLLGARADIAAVAIIGRPDPDWGQRVTAVIVTEQGHAEPELESIRDCLAPDLPVWALPKDLEFRADLPRTSLGKVRRNLL